MYKRGTENVRQLKVGVGPNYTNIDKFGTITFNGNSTTFDDVRGDALTLRQSGAGVSPNVTESTVDFTTGANLSDYMYFNVQIPHKWKIGSTVFPHIHWIQSQDTIPNLLIQYRWQINGGAKTTGWTNYKCNVPAYTYLSGNLNQICHDGGILAPVGSGLSDEIQIRVLRDNANTSTVFASSDPVAATISIISVDVHFEQDKLGSDNEY